MKKIMLLILFGLMAVKPAWAQSNTVEGRIEKIIEEREEEVLDRKQIYQKMEVKTEDKLIEVETSEVGKEGHGKYKVGDKVMLSVEEGTYRVIDFVRKDGLILLSIVFVIATLLVAGLRGIASLASMVGTFFVVTKFMLPQLVNGANPMIIALISSLIIIPITFLLSHGWNGKTGVAITGTVLSLIATSLLATAMVDLVHLSGISSEEAGFLLSYNIGGFDFRGLLLAGIIIGSLGVLDDITVSQAGIVEDIVGGSEKIKKNQVFARAMKIGRDHITSMVNTLILVYTGAAMPLLLLFSLSRQNYGDLINYEFMAEEIVRTLTGSIGLILAVPVTTLLAVWWFTRPKLK